MITFFTHLRPFDKEFGPLQRRSIQSWQEAVPGCEILTYGPGDMTIKELFEKGQLHASNDLLCEISSDIMLTDNFGTALTAIERCEKPFVIGQRYDQAKDGTMKLHPPTAADYFIFRKGTLGQIPPFHIGRTAYDNWFVWAAIDWGLTVIDATRAITAVHQNHSYPEYGDREKMLKSDEKKENYQMAKTAGMPRWYAVNDAPFVFNGKGINPR